MRDDVGVNVLINQNRLLRTGGGMVAIAGVDDPHYGRDDIAEAMAGYPSPGDPLLGDLGDSQSINPYAYVGNRPLSRLRRALTPTGTLVLNGGGAVVASAPLNDDVAIVALRRS